MKKMEFSKEMIEDLEKMRGLDISSHLEEVLAEELGKSIDKENAKKKLKERKEKINSVLKRSSK